MSQWPQDPPDNVIRITREEANSAHVDDLLKRQMSLEGSPQVTRGVGRRWYYQNWFVLMIVGGAAAFGAWALLEPFYDDAQYIQGTIDSIDPNDVPGQIALGNGQFFAVTLPTHGSVSLKGEHIWLYHELK